MKLNKWYIILFFLFIFLYYGKDILFLSLSKEDVLSESIILKSDYDTLKSDYDKLLEVNNLWNNLNYDFITSKVIVRDPYLFYEEITILKGSEDGISVGDVVEDSSGFIGIISNVKKHSSQVKLLTHKDTMLQVRVDGYFGILKKSNNSLWIQEMKEKKEISIGSEVYTSTYTGIPSILIGTVEEVKETNIGQELKVKPSVDFDSILYVMIRKKENHES